MPKKGNMPVPTKWSGQDRRFAETLKNSVDILAGFNGDPLDRAITARDLLDSGIATLAAGSTVFSGGSADLSLTSTGNLPTYDVPPAPTNLSADGAFQNIIVTWNLESYAGHSYVEVYRHTSDAIAAATLIAQVSGTVAGIYADSTGPTADFYYWVRAVNENGVAGPFNSSVGTRGQTAPDVSFLLTTLNGAITSGELATSLSTPIGQISGMSVTLSSHTTNLSTLDGSVGSLNGSVSSLNGSVSSLSSIVSNPTTGLVAKTDATTLRLDNVGSTTMEATFSAQAGDISGLNSKYTVKIDTNGAVAGFGLASTSNAAGNIISEFIVNADRFAIMRGGSNTATATTPFVVQATATTLNGVAVPAGVYMTDAFIKNGSIVSAKIGTLSADKITTGFINAARIQTNTIDASKIRLDNSTITSQTIGGVPTVIIKNLGVDTAQINSLAVQTVKIDHQAVTIPTSSYTAGEITVSTYSGWALIQSVEFTSSGNPVHLNFSCLVKGANATAGSFLKFRLRRVQGNSVRYGPTPVTYTYGTQAALPAFSCKDTPSAGTVTYKVEGQIRDQFVVGSKVSFRTLLALEVKK